MATEGHDHRGVEDLELTLQIRRARCNLARLGVAVAGWPALHDVRDVNLLAAPADCFQQLIEQAACLANERPAFPVFVVPGALADEDDLRISVAVTWYGLRASLVQRAQIASRNLGRDLVECLLLLIRRHAA